MSYLVLARKWRPKNFEEMVGQEHIAQTIRNALSTGRIAHAYLFTGTRGVGKTTAARILAKALNCQKGPTPTPCETCENCLAVNSGSSMDVLEIDGASNNGVENVRELREQVKYAPMHGTYKVYIIDEVHMLSKSAFNALLKTLEEPPPHVVFVFATTESGKVPITIMSRVQRFDFKRISESAIRDRLEFIAQKEGILPQREALEAISRKADGSMRDALSLFDRVFAFAGSDMTFEATRTVLGIPSDSLFDTLLQHISNHNAAGCFSTLEEVYQQGLEPAEFLLGFGEFLRDMLFARQEGITSVMLGLGESRFQDLRKISGDLQDGDLLRFARLISELLSGLRNAPHPRLWIELGLARLAALDRIVTLSQLLSGDSVSEEIKKKNPTLDVIIPIAPIERTLVKEETIPLPEEPGIPDSTLFIEIDTIVDITLNTLSLQWQKLIDNYSLTKPFTSGPLRLAKPFLNAGESPEIEVRFANVHQHDLFLADKQNKRDFVDYLRSNVKSDKKFSLRYAFNQESDEKSSPNENSLESKLNSTSENPALKSLLQKFEGRLLEPFV